MYFSYNFEDGFEFHNSEKEAKDRAESCLELERDEASEGWAEEVDQTCWGKVSEKVIQTECKIAPEGSEHDEYWDFALLKVD
jgi:hypothetical protein